MRRTICLAAVVLSLIFGVASVSAAAPSPPPSSSVTTSVFPDVIALPDGYFPEGIAVGAGHDVYVGSLVDGAIWKGDLRTGEGAVLVPGTPGTVAVGLDYDPRSGYLFVSGGAGGTVTIVDGDTGAVIDQLALGAGFINDVIVTRTAAYLTNSAAPELYEVPLDARGRVTGDVRVIPLGGEFTFIPGAFNANGIEAAAPGDALIVAGSAAAELYAVDPATGSATVIAIDGLATSVTGDGLTLVGHTLYVNENRLNRIAVIELSADLSSGTVVDYLTSEAFQVPTTTARFGSSLYAVNAKFGTPATPTTPYEIVRVDRTR